MKGQGVGSALLRFVFNLAHEMTALLGCVGVVVDAKLGAVAFYKRYGFVALEAEAESRPRLPAGEDEEAMTRSVIDLSGKRKRSPLQRPVRRRLPVSSAAMRGGAACGKPRTREDRDL